MTRIKLLTAVLFLGITFQVKSQYFVRLSKMDNPSTVKKIFVHTRVGCVLNPDAKGKYKSLSHVGVVKKISPDSIRIAKSDIAIGDIRGIGKRMGGTTILSTIITFVGVGLLRSSSTDNTPCPTCQTVNSDTGGNAGYIIGGVGMIGLSILIIANNSPKSMKKWRLEVIGQTQDGRKE